MSALGELRAVCSAPGKVILFGEHAVVYGHPAVAAAIDQRTAVEVNCCGDRVTVNGFRIHERFHSYLMTAVQQVWRRDDPVRLQTEGGVPSASGTGSSAALTVAAVGALRRLQGLTDLPGLAADAFRVERSTQGGGSPTDTSTATAGGAVAIGGLEQPPGVGETLWDLRWDKPGEERGWRVERIPMPPLTAVVGNSGVKGRTDEQVAKVAHAARKNALVRDRLREIGDLTREAVGAIRHNDWGRIGQLMDRNHAALHTLGINHPAVQALVEAARRAPGTFGAKLTGAGGGGSMVVLTENPPAAAQAIRQAGGTPYIVTLGGPGAMFHDSLEAAQRGEPLPAEGIPQPALP